MNSNQYMYNQGTGQQFNNMNVNMNMNMNTNGNYGVNNQNFGGFSYAVNPPNQNVNNINNKKEKDLLDDLF
jgi:hypothetical protein